MSFKERLKTSVMRTIVAFIIIYVATDLLKFASNWQQWTSRDSDFGVLLVDLMFFCGIIAIIYGIYMISPIYISLIAHAFSNWIIECTKLSDPDEFEIKDKLLCERRFFKKIKKLKKIYIW